MSDVMRSGDGDVVNSKYEIDWKRNEREREKGTEE